MIENCSNGPDGKGGPARWWTDFNYGPDVAAPIVRRKVEEEEDTKTTAETDKTLGETGWVRTEESFRDTYGEGWVRKDAPQAPSGSQSAPIPASAEQPGQPAKPAPAIPASFAADDPRPLYVSRALLNTSDFLQWAQQQGFASTLRPDDLHVTVMYSKRPVNWFAMGDWCGTSGELVVPAGGPRLVERMGTEGAIALIFGSADLQYRHRQMRDAGASWDYPSYLPHVTISYDARGIDLATVQPYQGMLVFGPERFEGFQSDVIDTLEETPTSASFAETTPPAAAQPDAVDSVVDRMIAADGYRVADAMTGPLVDRVIAANSEAEARALIASALGIMDEAPLMQALERAGFAVKLDAASQPAPTEN